MNAQTKRTLRSRTLNLIPLRTALLAAEKDAPSRVPRWDANEQLAIQLIEAVKAEHAALNPFQGWGIEPPQATLRESVREMAESHV